MLHIRAATEADWPALWAVLEPTFRRGDTYTYPPDITEEQARQSWMTVPTAIFVACDDQGTVLGTYAIRPNQPGQGAHVGNCGYVVSDTARGLGVASALCEHSQQEALRMGFCALQFNFVVSTNEGAVRLWRKMGFAIVGTLPGAFRHPTLGFVDAYVMFKQLKQPE
ncbi:MULTISPECIES: GNAT family N-acetyltransferase [unclassified Variovorax]|uniref:GNAT family N-acetyltransferase n=1 Tax=unclassified Variovorax TaxID=663243 RepID=UPI002576F360|nr:MULTISPECIES: GNAT family N-acetyltransferase [unclassified Variovorax]MDM0085891.1 GNAT family N-acetyltransferase [Variovorax sp. J22G40]MDM0145851.1 GNAT family N-acetyltransferase [Variovorax sp. J2P1-31]